MYQNSRQKDYFNDGLQLQLNGNYLEAINCYDQAIQNHQNLIEVNNNKGLCLIELNRNEEAIECFEQIIKLDKKYINAYNNKGLVLSRLNRREESIECYDEALSRLNTREESIECYDEALHYTLTRDILINKGLDLQFLGKHKLAIQCFEEALNVDRENVDLYIYKANTLKMLGQHNEALELYRKVLKDFDPKNIDALNNAGVILNELGIEKEAIQYFDQIISNHTNKSEAFNNKGVALLHFKRYEEAIECFSSVLSFDTDHIIAQANRARAHLALGQIQQAEKDFERIVQLIQSNGKQDLSNKQIDQSQNILNEYKYLRDQITQMQKEIVSFCLNLPEKREFIVRNSKIYFELIILMIMDKTLESIFNNIEQINNDKIIKNNKEVNEIGLSLSKFSEQMNKNQISEQQICDFILEQIDYGKQLLFTSKQNEKSGLLESYIVTKEIINLKSEFNNLQNEELELLNYCKVFYWTSLNMFIVYMKLQEELNQRQNFQSLQQLIQSKKTQVEEEIKMQTKYLQLNEIKEEQFSLVNNIFFANIPFLGDIVNDINDLICKTASGLLLNKTEPNLNSYKINIDKINTVIYNKFLVERSISIRLAKVAITLSNLNRKQIIYNFDDISQIDKNNRLMNIFENRIQNIKNKLLSQLQIKDDYSRGAQLAIRDIVLFMAFMLKNSNLMLRMTQTNIIKMVQDLHSVNAYENLLKDKNEEKNNCSCTIFLVNNLSYENQLINCLSQARGKISSSFLNFLIKEI